MASETHSAAGKARKILMLTNSDHGQSNVFLATSHHLLQLDPDVEVHFATFGGIEKAINSTSEHALNASPNAKPIVYHKINGLSMGEGILSYVTRNNVPRRHGYFPESFLTPLDFSTTKQALKDSIPIFVPYTGEQLAEIVTSVKEIIKKVEPEMVVVDGLMTAGLTALWQSDVKHMCLSPNTIKEFAAAAQPRGERFWKYPALFSGYSYPVPLSLIPLNIFFLLYMAYVFITTPQRKEAEKYLADNLGMKLRTPIDLLRNRPDGLKIAVGFLPELDFPGIVPEHVLPCGPILRSAPPVTESDPPLGEWLSKGPTVYVNLGSICHIDEQQTLGMAKALKLLIDDYKRRAYKPLQVLWKLKKYGDFKVLEDGSDVREELGKEIDADQVRIVDWVVAEPIAVLETGNIVLSVHHGGANSFNEAVCTGTPQVVLPQWTDCYDFANRVELLDIGCIGNKSTKPRWTSDELSKALIKATLGVDAIEYKHNAVDLAKVCESKGNGAENAARALLKQANTS